MLLNSNSIHPITNKLITWYQANKRDLPWRQDPQPYTTWLSEIIFQQTRIDQGLGYYERLLAKFPTVFDLAKASENEVLKAWEGLGYYSRARNLHFTAKHIVSEYDGKFPEDHEEIIGLKGIGPYTAAAIASIAFKKPYPAIDGNVLRVVSRLFKVNEAIDLPSTKRWIENELLSLIDKDNPGDFNQAMMELGALICKPRNPNCEQCPISEHCMAYADKVQEDYPIKKKKVKVKNVYFSYLVFHTDTSILLEKRGGGIWKGLHQFPLKESDHAIDEADIYAELTDKFGDNITEVVVSAYYKHILSHRKIMAKFYLIKVISLPVISNFKAVSKKRLKDHAMPQLIIRFLRSDSAKQKLM
jgi:A/G-specific adenine glycosylase